MILCLRHLVLSLASSIIFSSISQAQETSSCIYTEHTAANATGFAEVAEFQPFIQTPVVHNSIWTISTAINEVQDFESNSYVVEQSFWSDTSPLISTSPADLPYMGCIILLTGFSSPKISTGTNSSDSCNGVFDTSCYDAILDIIDEFIMDNTAPSIPNVCQTIIATPPAQCKNYAWTALSATCK
jgi:hypothetical protein